MKDIIHTVDIQAAPDAVYQAITTEKGLRNWWSTQVRIEGEQDSRIHFTFIEGFNPVIEVTATEENRKVHWRCIDGAADWQDNTFSFRLKGSDGRSSVIFRQHYVKEPEDEVYGRYNHNWGYYLNSLRLFCETGNGTPYEV